jgi:hypothetical protein
LDQLLVPQSAMPDSVSVWVGTRLPPSADWRLQAGLQDPVLIGDTWASWRVGDRPRFWAQRLELDGLEPGRRYPVRLLDGDSPLAIASAVTLPEDLPTRAERPFTCLIGSCFAYLSDEAGAAGAAYARLPSSAQPHVKFLAGDQVYLDAPFPRFLFNMFGTEDLRAELLAGYVAVWMQGGDGWGFSELLRSGSTWFCSDDHEIWNNAPSPTPTVRATWWPFGDHGASWLQMATELYQLFQSPRRLDTFRVGRLSFMVLDTRLERTRDRSRLCSPAALKALAAWVDDLPGPGVLVVGQPLLMAQAGIKGHFTDWGLPDFGQYTDIVRILGRTKHDLLILTGDVHYGRVAGCELASGATLTELIASPLALVDPRVGGHWAAPPNLFPAFPVAGINPRSIWVDDRHQLTTNQFATVEFAAGGARVHASVRSWPIPAPGTAPTSTTVFERTLN